MFGRTRLAAACLLAASAAIPQDLAPDVLLLSRIKRHLREELAHVPNYTCLETISRSRSDTQSTLRLHNGLAKLDTIQLEIVYTDGKEWYGSPGAGSLSVANPVAFIGTGMIGTGAFAMTMNNMVEGGIFTYRGEEPLAGRRAVKYDYRISSLTKALRIALEGAVGDVGEEGSMWVNPESLDVIRIASHATDIPPYLPLARATMSVDYAHMRIAGKDALLAQAADSRMVDTSGIDSYNRIDFTHCHSYSTNSEITFGEKVTPAAATVPAALTPGAALPALLDATTVLTAPVSDKDFVGSAIDGKISGDVVRKGKIVIPDGSLVHGRIRALDRYPDYGVFAVGLEFTDVEVHGESLPFYADALRLDKYLGAELDLSRWIFVRGRSKDDRIYRLDESLTLPDLPGVAYFFVKGDSFALPAGFRIVWRTRGLIQ